ncbi:MAG: DUF481 domain-containing protein [Betaproteobacteria bacterium]|nr:DUF481 domain-containing protein [Betaproteobacteria bacterium]
MPVARSRMARPRTSHPRISRLRISPAGAGRCCLALLLGAALCGSAAAAESATSNPPNGPWTGSAELGGVATTGNSRTSSLDGKFTLGYASGPWSSDLHLEVLRASAAGTTTANRLFGELNTRRTLDGRDYVFGDLRGTHDTFSGYRYQSSAAVGLGRELLHTPAVDLRAELGPGYRLAQVDGGPTQRNAVVRAHGAFVYRFTSKAHFDQSLTAIAGSDNTEIDSVTALTTAITGALALKLSYTVLHNTTVPLGRKKTDTYTAINLVYSF